MGTASNDHQELRLTGSLPLVQKSLTGVGFRSFFFFFLKEVFVFVFVFVLPPSGGCRLGGMRCHQSPNGPHEAAQLPPQRRRRHLGFLVLELGQMLVSMMQA